MQWLTSNGLPSKGLPVRCHWSCGVSFLLRPDAPAQPPRPPTPALPPHPPAQPPCPPATALRPHPPAQSPRPSAAALLSQNPAQPPRAPADALLPHPPAQPLRPPAPRQPHRPPSPAARPPTPGAPLRAPPYAPSHLDVLLRPRRRPRSTHRSSSSRSSFPSSSPTALSHCRPGRSPRAELASMYPPQSPPPPHSFDSSTAKCPYVIRTGDCAGQTCGKAHTQHRCFSRLEYAWRAEFGDKVERPHWEELLRSGVAIFDLDYDASPSFIYALSASAEGDCYHCVPPDPGTDAAALGASESVLPGTAPTEALHTFTLDSGASRSFFRDSTTLTPLPAPVPVRLADPSGGPVVARSSTVLPCPAVPSESLSSLRLPLFSTNLVSTAALQDAMVTTTTHGGQCVSICLCTRMGRHLATFTRRPGSSLYTLATEPPQVAASAQVSASGQVSASPPALACPALPSLHRGVAARRSSLLLFSPDDCSPADSPHGHVNPSPRQWTGPRALLSAVRLQLREWFRADLPVLHLHSDRGGEFSSDLLWDFCRGEGILQSFMLLDSPKQNRIVGRRIGLVMEVARTSMIHAAAPHFMWPFVVWYVAHQLNLWPRVSFPETSPTLRWTGKVGDASVFRDVTFDESVPFYRLFPYRSAPSPPPPLFLAPGPPPVDPLPPQGPAPPGMSQVDPLPGTAPVQVAVSSGAARGVASGGAASEGAEPGVAESEGAVSGGAEPGGEEPGGAEPEGGSAGASPRLSPQQLREWLVRHAHLRSGATGAGGAGAAGAGGAGVTARAGGTGGTAATGPGGARTRGAATAPPATADNATRSQWLIRDATAHLAIRNHLLLAECAHFEQHRTAQARCDAVVARYSSPTTAALGRLLLPYLFPEPSAFATVEDLVSHLRASDARYRATVPAEFLDRNQPPMFITLYFIVTRLPESLRSVRDHFLSLDPTVLTVDLLEEHLLATETSAVAVDAARGTPRTPFFEGCSPSPLAPSYASAAAADVPGAEDVGAASASAKRRTSKGKGGRGGGGGSGSGGGGSSGGSGGGGGGGGGRGGVGGTGGGGGGSGGGGGGSSGSGGSGGGGTGGGRSGARRGDLLRSGVAIFNLDFDVILFAMYALSISAEGDYYQCVPPDPGIAAAALGAIESGTLPGTAPAEALHTFMLDSGASPCFFRDSTTLTPLPAPVPVRLADPSGGPVVARSSTVLPCPAVPSGSLSSLHLPSFSTNLVSTAALQDAMVTTTTPGGQRVLICTCTWTGPHLATFTRRPGSSLYTLATEPPQVAASTQVSASGQVTPPCSCRLMSHQTLLWHHRLGHPSLPRLRGMQSRLLVSGLSRSLPPLPPSPNPPCLPCVEGRQRAAPHSSSFPPTIAPLQTLHMDRFRVDLPTHRLHSDRGGEFSSDLLRDFCHGEGILQSFTLSDSPQQNGIAQRRIGLVMEARVSLPGTSPILRWTGKVGDASVFRVWVSRAFVRDTSADKLSAHTIPCVFLGFVPDPPGRQFYHPTSRRVLPSKDVTFDESVPFYRLFPYRYAPLLPSPLFLAPGSPPVDPLPPHGPAPSGVSQVDPPPGAEPGEVAVDSGAARGTAFGGAEPGGAEPGGNEFGGAESGGAEPKGVEPRGADSEGAESRGVEPQGAASFGGSASASPRLSSQQLRDWRCWQTAGACVLGGTAATGPKGARSRGTGAAGIGGVGGAGAGDPTESGAAGAGGSGAGRVGAGGARDGGTGAGGARAGGAGVVDPGGTVRPQSYFVPLLQQVLGVLSSTGLTPPLLCPPPDQSQPSLQPTSPLPAPSPYTEQTGSLIERRAPASRPASPVRPGRRVPRPRPPPIPGTHAMTLRPSSVPLHVPLPVPPESSLPEVPDPESDRARAASPTVSRLLATAITHPSFESSAASALVAELLDLATACRLDYATAPVAESTSASPPSVGEAITGPYSSQWQATMDVEMASWKSASTYVDEVPPPGANIVDGMWIFRVKRPPGSPPAFKAHYVARGFSQRQGVDYFQTFSPTPKMTTLRSLHEDILLRCPPGFTGSFPAGTHWSLRRPVYGLRQAPREWHDTLRTTLAALGFAPSTTDPSPFLRTDTSLPSFYVLVYVDDLVFATVDTEAVTLVNSELQKRLTSTDLGELRSYLGLLITRD
ncbi:unnamed protein product [Closterium sp. NIES-54]